MYILTEYMQTKQNFIVKIIECLNKYAQVAMDPPGITKTQNTHYQFLSPQTCLCFLPS